MTKWIVVTGAAGGIGQACIPVLLDRGYSLLLVDRPGSPLEAVARDAEAHASERDGAVTAVESGLEDLDECTRVTAAVPAPLYGLVHLAGVFEPDPNLARDMAVWDRAIAHNLTSAYSMATAVEARLQATTLGRLVFISSLAFRRGSASHVPYAVAKGGLVGLIRSLSKRFAHKALVNGLAPGIIDTSMPRHLIAEHGERLLREIPLGRYGAAREVATVIKFLLSEDASYITGQVLNVDGGLING